jgi:hypothetical protein
MEKSKWFKLNCKPAFEASNILFAAVVAEGIELIFGIKGLAYTVKYVCY